MMENKTIESQVIGFSVEQVNRMLSILDTLPIQGLSAATAVVDLSSILRSGSIVRLTPAESTTDDTKNSKK